MRIRFEHIVKTFGTVRALDDVSLDIADGELVFLLGPSGCGKTTLLRCLAGFEIPDSGRILLDNDPVGSLPPYKRNSAMVFQGYALWPHMTVAENVSFGLQMRGVPAAELRSRVKRALEIVRIDELGHRKPNELSGGQQQRVALARTLVVEPGCLLLDEPLANLDAKLRRDMRTEIRRICKEVGLTAVYVTHDRQEALSMADRIAVLDGGRILQTGSPRDIYKQPVNAFVATFIGETNLVKATVTATEGNSVSVRTPFGELRGTMGKPGSAAPGTEVLVSLRPEAIRLLREDDGGIPATLRETTYLGEMAEHMATAGADTTLRLFELNPSTIPDPGSAVRLGIRPEDVVILPNDPV